MQTHKERQKVKGKGSGKKLSFLPFAFYLLPSSEWLSSGKTGICLVPPFDAVTLA